MDNLKMAYFGMQCFGGSEQIFAMLDGVLKTRVGYAGGTTSSPNYESIGDHTEIVELTFDEKTTSYEDLLSWFWNHHDPIQPRKKQYRSAILYVDEQQKEAAEKSLEKEQAKYGNKKLDTYVQKLDHFYQAEDYHQKYRLKQQKTIYDKLNLSEEEALNSTLAAKLNAFLAGYDNFDLLKQLARDYNLDDEAIKSLESIAKNKTVPGSCSA